MTAWAQTMSLWSWQSLLLIGFVLIIVKVARSQSATGRHSFWLLALLMIAILPVVNAIVRVVPVKTHVQRHDHWVNPLQAFLGAVFFFHPAVRYALRQLILERELACDEQVLSAGMSSSTYAEVILKVAEHSISGRQSDCPAFNSPGKILERRIEMILSYRPSVPSQRHLPAVGTAAIVLGLASLLLPQGAITAEMPVVPPPQIRVAAFPPLMEGVSVVTSAITKKAWAEPVQPVRFQAAQASPGTVSGTIFDPSGAVVPGVTVTLLAVPAGTFQTGVTDGIGLFTFFQVAPGQYRLQTRLPGFSSTERTILMGSGGTLVQDVSIPLARVTTSVEVSASRPTTPQNANTAPLPRRVGGVIAQPNLLSQVKPQYPAAARSSGIEGFVQLQAVIGKDGTILALEVDPNGTGTGDPEFTRAAMDAVRQWRYRPGMLNGSPIEVATTIIVNFSLQ